MGAQVCSPRFEPISFGQARLFAMASVAKSVASAFFVFLVASCEGLTSPPDDCLAAANKYRSKLQLPDTQYCPGTQMDLATEIAKYDASHGYHQYTADHPQVRTYCPQGFAGDQNEWGWNHQVDDQTWDEIVECWYNDGPDGSSPGPVTKGGCQPQQGQHDHYYALAKKDMHCVACGFFGTDDNFMFTVDLCEPMQIANSTMMV